MSAVTVWLIILVAGIGTFSLRASFIFLLERAYEMETLKQVLRFVPPAVLAALVSSGLVLRADAFEPGQGGNRLIAGLTAALIAWKTRSILATIAGGMCLFWILSCLM